MDTPQSSKGTPLQQQAASILRLGAKQSSALSSKSRQFLGDISPSNVLNTFTQQIGNQNLKSPHVSNSAAI